MAGFLDLETWSRREHFYFFRAYDNPYFNLCADVDITTLKLQSRERAELSLSLALFFASLKAANGVEPFRYRIRDQRVWVHDTIDCGSTVLRPDDSFGFGYFPFVDAFSSFSEQGRRELDRVKGRTDLEPSSDDDNVIHYSVIPWVSFTSFSHARRWNTDESIPKLVFGKYFERDGRWLMPVSVEVHHSLMDGLHVGRFFEAFQALLDDPDTFET